MNNASGNVLKEITEKGLGTFAVYSGSEVGTHDVTASRVFGTAYKNTLSVPIFLTVQVTDAVTEHAGISIDVNGTGTVSKIVWSSTGVEVFSLYVYVAAGLTYTINLDVGSATILKVFETY